MQKKIFVFLALFLFSALELNSQSDIFSKTRIFLQDGKWDKLISALDKDLEKSTAVDKELMLFQKAYALFQMGKLAEAEVIFTEIKDKNKTLSEYVLFYLGQISLGKKDNAKAKENFQAILNG